MRGMFSISKLKQQLESETKIEKLFEKRINEAIVKLNEKAPSSPSYKPSSLVCPRMMYFIRTGVEPDTDKVDPSSVGIFESGTDRHDRIQHVLDGMKDLGMEFEYIDVPTYVKQKKLKDIKIVGKKGMETKCYNEKLKMSFLTDGIIRYIPEDKYFIFEYKTEVTQKFQKREKQELTHEIQATAYALNFHIDDVLFVYEDRNVCNKKAFRYTVTDEDKQTKVVKKIEYVEKCIADNKIPRKVLNEDLGIQGDWGNDRKCGEPAKVCNWCNYKKSCNKYM